MNTSKPLRESDIETHLVKRCKEIGAICEKFTSPNRRSVPDRVITYHGKVVFVELKAPGKIPTQAQWRDHSKRLRAGAEVTWTDCIAGVEGILKSIANGKWVNYGFFNSSASEGSVNVA